MMGATSIEWTDWSVNPIRAKHKKTGAVGHYCEKVSAGCANCYASRLQRRFQMPAFGAGQRRNDVEVYLDEKVLQQVLKRKKPTKIFWCDMSDLFGQWVPDEWIDRCFAVMALTPQHVHQVLTKRSKRMVAYLWEALQENGRWDRLLYDGRFPWPDCSQAKIEAADLRLSEELYLSNVWLGVSVENREQLERVDHLRVSPAAVRFLSIEPLLEDLGTLDLTDIHWVIVGGESGANARPMHWRWVYSIRDQCVAAGVPFFFKQWGEWVSGVKTPNDFARGATSYLPGKYYDFGDSIALRAGKQRAGRLLDGRTWDEMPGVNGG